MRCTRWKWESGQRKKEGARGGGCGTGCSEVDNLNIYLTTIHTRNRRPLRNNEHALTGVKMRIRGKIANEMGDFEEVKRGQGI